MSDPILITGGATRLGFALATHYLENNQPVVITFRTERPELKELEQAGQSVSMRISPLTQG